MTSHYNQYSLFDFSHLFVHFHFQIFSQHFNFQHALFFKTITNPLTPAFLSFNISTMKSIFMSPISTPTTRNLLLHFCKNSQFSLFQPILYAFSHFKITSPFQLLFNIQLIQSTRLPKPLLSNFAFLSIFALSQHLHFCFFSHFSIPPQGIFSLSSKFHPSPYFSNFFIFQTLPKTSNSIFSLSTLKNRSMVQQQTQ